MEQSKNDSESGATYGEYAGIKYWYFKPCFDLNKRHWVAVYTYSFPMFAVPCIYDEIDEFMLHNYLDSCITNRLKDDLKIR